MANFKELIVWQKAVRLVVEVYKITRQLPKVEQFGLASQMQRAVVSIPSNIAEGYRRNNRKEFYHFCAVALGSAAELETQLIIVGKVYGAIDIETAHNLIIEVQKMLFTLIKKLGSSSGGSA